MSWRALWLFIPVTFLVSATPGPNMLLVMSSSVRFGVRAAVATMAGCLSALLAMMSLSAAGLGALLQAFPAVFDGLRWLGAAYLAYLGIRTWRAPVRECAGIEVQPEPQPVRRGSLYRQGLLVAASNPKAILFAAAFFPQFIQPQAPKLPQFAVLLLAFAVIETTWYAIYAGSGRRLAQWLQRAAVMRGFNRVTGGVFVGFAAIMAAVRE